MRSISTIAREISVEWKNVSPYAKPYLNAMLTLHSTQDKYGLDDAHSIISYFLANASSFRGGKAKELKAELKALAK